MNPGDNPLAQPAPRHPPLLLEAAAALDLATGTLINYRAQRYHGDFVCSRMADFAEVDREILRALYRYLSELFHCLDPAASGNKIALLRGFMQEFPTPAMLEQVRAFGNASYALNRNERMAKTVHDLRGGPLTSLLGHLAAFSRATRGADDEALIFSFHRYARPGALLVRPETLFPLVRDHLKIMRNAVQDLDEPRRARDLLLRAHSIDLLTQKWQHAFFEGQENLVQVRVECAYPGHTISECCVESAAVDRVLYNIINNAARHAASAYVDLLMLPIPPAEGAENVRFCVSNTVAAQEIAGLQAMIRQEGGLRSLFEPGVSTTGSGLGLAIAAEFIANAYGLSSVQDALEGGYLGVALREETFTAWFHWPLSDWLPNVSEPGAPPA